MGEIEGGITAVARNFIEGQRMFFVSTAPLAPDGHVNLSPKGLETFRILGPTRVAYLDCVGSGAETIAHVRENGRITIMFCAFAGAPKILRLYGRGHVVVPGTDAFGELRPLFPSELPSRAIIDVAVHRVADSCGYGVPVYQFQRDRSHLDDWSARKGAKGLVEYQRTRNARSLDDLPAVTWFSE